MSTPKVSLIVIVYRMPAQAERTLYTLSPDYQQGVSGEEYEVIVVENSSDAPMGEAAATRYADNVSYFYREETSRSPVNAINFGVEQARAPVIGLMIDGARMLSPGVVLNILRALQLSDTPVISVPGYHLGRTIQQEAVDSGYNEQVEAELLASINWPHTDGYDLFNIACLSGSCAGGFFRPIAESNCLCMPTWLFKEIGGCDPRFDLPGGGNINLDMYRRACDHPRSELFVFPGEGSFHQFHGGVTTNLSKQSPERQKIMQDLNAQYEKLRGEKYSAPQKAGVCVGWISPQAMRFVHLSAQKAMPKP